MTTNSDAISLFFFAHQDDELGVLPRMVEELGKGIRPICLFLTSGVSGTATTGHAKAIIRNDESRKVLVSQGCTSTDIYFLGLDIPIDDGSLFRNLDEANEACNQALTGIPEASIQNVYCPAWEGGHHDHDAAQLIALAQAIQRGALTRTYQFPLYNGKGLPGSLFRPQSPIVENGAVLCSRVPRLRAVSYWLLARHYHSQWRTWMGLLIPAVLKAAWSPGLSLQPVSRGRVTQRPHSGALFYERRYAVSYESFSDSVRPFIESRILMANGQQN